MLVIFILQNQSVQLLISKIEISFVQTVLAGKKSTNRELRRLVFSEQIRNLQNDGSTTPPFPTPSNLYLLISREHRISVLSKSPTTSAKNDRFLVK